MNSISKLKELIQQLCPDGVEYKLLKECCILSRGDYITKKSARLGNIPVILGGQEPAYYIEKANHYGKAIVISRSGASAGFVSYWDEPIFVTDGFIIETKQDLSMRFLYYLLKNLQSFLNAMKKGGGVPHITGENLLALKIPIPPLPVQSEIVRILDNFTELTARKKQYEFYRAKLLSFDAETDGIEWRALAEIADIGTGSSNTNEGLYPFFVRSQEPRRKNEYEFDETAIITAGDGVGVGKVFHYVEGKYALHQRAYRIHINTADVLPKYYFHYMQAMFLPYIQKTMFQGSVASIRRPMLNEFPVPVPSLSVQEHIIAVLDRFDTLCNDLTSGLPAEIEARQKQYEYYRDKLLSFKELNI